MSESFVKARQIFDQVMEESLAKYNPGGQCHSFSLTGYPNLDPGSSLLICFRFVSFRFTSFSQPPSKITHFEWVPKVPSHTDGT